ncbi:dihydrofolate reductase family protein [Haliangium sp.]|uniref:dihydrofolate reductase family protein n=1 Tax=Haliangium sp. TaxID=2663208 RepID=UPI003D143C95
MRHLIYDIAVTVDGFIAHEDGSIGGFAMEGEHVDEYMARLQGYDTVVMGRATYEMGYAFGLPPGQRAYPHMEHYIVSSTLSFGPDAAVKVVAGDPAELVRELKAGAGGDIYLCGGAALAGHLLDQGLIDQVVLKLNPVSFGRGIPLFGASSRQTALRLVDAKAYPNGVVLTRYDAAPAQA